jgi:segregation and condensation protein B
VNTENLKQLVEAILFAAEEPMSLSALQALIESPLEPITKSDLLEAIKLLTEDCENRGVELQQVASGYRFQVKQAFADTVIRLWEEKPKKYSRALLETLSLIAYRQPLTRAEIEDVRGVSVSSSIVKTLIDRDWIHVIGHRETPGRPALYATTKGFLNYFNLRSLDELPSLKELQDLDAINPSLDLGDNTESSQPITH